MILKKASLLEKFNSEKYQQYINGSEFFEKYVMGQ